MKRETAKMMQTLFVSGPNMRDNVIWQWWERLVNFTKTQILLLDVNWLQDHVKLKHSFLWALTITLVGSNVQLLKIRMSQRSLQLITWSKDTNLQLQEHHAISKMILAINLTNHSDSCYNNILKSRNWLSIEWKQYYYQIKYAF